MQLSTMACRVGDFQVVQDSFASNKEGFVTEITGKYHPFLSQESGGRELRRHEQFRYFGPFSS